MMTMHTYKRGLLAVVAGTLLATAQTAAQPGLTFTAEATVKTPSRSGSRPRWPGVGAAGGVSACRWPRW